MNIAMHPVLSLCFGCTAGAIRHRDTEWLYEAGHLRRFPVSGSPDSNTETHLGWMDRSCVLFRNPFHSPKRPCVVIVRKSLGL